ncbi:MAG: polysaccharide pyruvyl transferase family protein [Candidatus Methanomethylicia archaeon]
MIFSRRRVAVFGYYGAGNLGDDIILYAVINRLSRFMDKSRIVVISSEFKADLSFINSRYGVEAISLFRNPWHLFKALLSCKFLVMGGGGIVQPGLTILSDFLYALLFRIFGCRVLLLSVGIEFPHSFSIFDKFILRLLMGISDMVTVRDLVSKAFLKSLDISKPVLLVRDLSFLLYDDIHRISKDHLFLKVPDPYVIVVLKDLQSYRKVVDLNLKSLEDSIVDLCNYLVDVMGLNVIFLVVHHGFRSDVYETVRVMKRINCKNGGRVSILIYRDLSFMELLSLISNASCVISMRFHPILLAFMVGTPIIGLSYSNKIKTFMEENYLKHYYIDLTRLYDLSIIKRLVSSILYHRIEIHEYNAEKIHYECLSEVSCIESLLEQNI